MVAARLVLLLFLQLGVSCAVAERQKVVASGREFFIDAPAEWVKPRVPGGSTAPAGSADKSVAYLLMDHQVLVAPDGTERYFRMVMMPTERAGLEQVSQIEIQFDPEYQQLVVHEIAVVRAGARIKKLEPSSVKIVQRERELEHQVYDGAVSALFVLTDVRVGDRVDFSYTLKGDNPALGKKFAGTVGLGYAVPVASLHVRVRFPSERSIDYRLHGMPDVAPRRIEDRGHRELLWHFAPTPVIGDEDSIPPWYFHYPWLQLSEYADWKEVATWAAGLFQAPEGLSAELEQRIAAWRGERADEAERARAALDFVQHEVRYFAVSLGESAHRPSHPDVVMQRRYGDCKDKALLLTVLLRRLGIEAFPALVSLRAEKAVERLLPSPAAFDHVIVQARISGETFWLDGTRSHQNAPLALRGNTAFGKALVVSEDTRSLALVGAAKGYRNGMQVEERIHIADYRKPGELVVTTTYFGNEAELVRASFARSDISEVARRSHEFHSRRYPGASSAQALTVNDSPESGSITVQEAYWLPRLLEYRELRYHGRLEPWSLVDHVRQPGFSNRKAPLAQSHPLEVTHLFVVQFPEQFEFRPGESINVADAALSFRYEPAYSNGKLTVRYEMKTRSDAVLARDMQAHLANRRRVHDALAYEFNVPLLSNEQMAAARREYRPVRDPLQASSQDVANEFLSAQRARTRALNSIIASAKLGGEDLARAHIDHATALSYQNLKALALKEIESALSINPKNAQALLLRGELRNRNGEFERALEDFEAAEALDADTGRLRYSRGQALFYLGRYEAAAADLEASLIQSTPQDAAYKLLWLYWATVRAGKKPTDVLAEHADRIDANRWPGAAVLMLQDKLGADEVIKAALHEDKRKEHPQLCEAYFYLGQRSVLAGDTAAARSMFERSVSTGISMYLEHAYSRIELGRLASPRR